MAGLRNQEVKNRAEAQSESEKDGDAAGLLIRSHPTTKLRSVIGFHVRILVRIPEWLTKTGDFTHRAQRFQDEGFECNRDLDEAAGAADATACSRIGSCEGLK